MNANIYMYKIFSLHIYVLTLITVVKMNI